MTNLKMVVWNMEWMNDLFGPNDAPPAFRADDEAPQHNKNTTIKKRRDDLAGVLNELSPDIIVVVEGPNRTNELQLFFDKDVTGEWKSAIQYSKGQTQNVGIAARTDQSKFLDPPFTLFDTNNIEAFDPFLLDTDDDEIKEQHQFERRPLYVEINPSGANNFRILGLHLKSKAIFGAYEWSKWWQIADANRKKILAQATQLRLQFLDTYLTDNETKDIPLIVCGDINDGPGLDASEKKLYGSAVERLMGTTWKPELCLGNALFDQLKDKERKDLNFKTISTTSFRDPIFNWMWHKVWIDHILYSKNSTASWINNATIHHTMTDGARIWEKYPDASDHHPISATISI
jgi:endonuclease/exonuclease/phosphatase family metal-dependent hydrolase